MAASSDPYEVLGSTRGKENFVRLSRLLVSGGTRIVREVFDRLCPPHELALVLSNEKTKAELKEQRFKNIHWDYLYPPSGGCGKSKEFNLNLLLKLLEKKEFCNVKFPVKGYKLPGKAKVSFEADLARIKYYYHSVFENVKVNMEITDDEFPLLWEEISGALLRLVKKHFRLEDQCAWKEAIDDLLKKSLTEGKVPPQEMEDFDSKPAEESIDEEHAASLEHTEDSTYSDGNSVSLIAGMEGLDLNPAEEITDDSINPLDLNPAEEITDDSINPAGKKKPESIVATAMEFEAMHKECLRVLPYSEGARKVVHLYVLYGKSGIPKKLTDAASKYFEGLGVDLEWFDLYKDANEILKISPVQYPTDTPRSLNESQIQAISKMIEQNLHILVRHRNITAVQPSLKITKSKQTETPCITLSVLRKGLIPEGDCAFPPTLGSYPVDVVDGFWFRTVDPWTPNEAQEQSEVLCLGASIGVKDEDVAGTLGAIVKGEETFYALSCDHVMRHKAKLEITHPAQNDHLNYLNYHLQQCRLWTKQMIKQDSNPILKSQMSDCTLTGPEELLRRFQDLKSVKETLLDPARKTKRKLQASDLHEKAFEEGSASPRVIGKYAVGVSRNVRWTDGQQYYIDAAIAELTSEEVKGLRESQTAELIGTGHRPSGKCSSNVKALGELCKSGRTTEFTKLGRHVQPSMFLNASLYEVNAQDEQLVSILKRIKLCQVCLERSETGHNLDTSQRRATLVKSMQPLLTRIFGLKTACA